MRLNRNRALALALLAPVVVTVSGCILGLVVGAGLGVAGMKYINGEGKASFGASLEQTRIATNQALEDLSWTPVDKGHDALIARIGALTAEGKDIKIEIKGESDKVSMVSIRVGTWGDKTITRMIFTKIEERLKTPR